MLRSRLNLVAGLLFALSGASFATASQAAVNQTPGEFINALGNEALQVLRATDISTTEREEQFRSLFVKGFDVNRISRFVLGRYWRRATPEQQKRYSELFEAFVVKSYARRLSAYDGETFEVKNTVVRNDREAMVETFVAGADGPPVRIDWRILTENGDHKIVDVVVEGVSMLITQRSEFAAVIERNGGNIDGLIQALERGVANMDR